MDWLCYSSCHSSPPIASLASFSGGEKAFVGWAQAFSLLPGLTGVYLRRAFYRLVLPRCEPDCCLCFGTLFSHPTAEIGRNVYVGIHGCLGDVTLEDDVLLGSHVSVINGGGQHGIDRLDLPIRDQPGTFPRVTIGHTRGSATGRSSLPMSVNTASSVRLGGHQADSRLRHRCGQPRPSDPLQKPKS